MSLILLLALLGALFWCARTHSRFRSLQHAVGDLYYGHRWSTPTLTDEQAAERWATLRDAAGFRPGDTSIYGG